MNPSATFRSTCAALAAVVTFSLLAGINSLSTHEYERAVLAQAASTQLAHAPSTARHKA